MASMKLPFTFILLISGLVVLGEIGATAAKPVPCSVQCFQGGYITCDNYPGKQLDGCDCQCAPKNGVNCVLHHLSTGDTVTCAAHA